MDHNTAMEAAKEGAKALTKFQEIIEKVFNPKWTRAQTDANMDANERKLQMIRDNPDMDIVFIGNEMHVRKFTPEELATRVGQRMFAEAICQETNIEKVLEVTAKELPSAETVSDEPVDDDWITRFFNIVKDISNEEMQLVWGKILAGEIQQPERFSLRTLDVLRNVSKTEAMCFQKLCNCAIQFGEDIIIPNNLSLLKSKGISYTDLVDLSEAGLLNLKELTTAGTEFPDNVTMHMQLCNKTHLIHITGKTEGVTRIEYGLYKFTRAGSELYSVLETEVDEQYILNVAKEVAQRNRHKASVFVHKIISHENGNIRYERTPIFAQESSVQQLR